MNGCSTAILNSFFLMREKFIATFSQRGRRAEVARASRPLWCGHPVRTFAGAGRPSDSGRDGRATSYSVAILMNKTTSKTQWPTRTNRRFNIQEKYAMERSVLPNNLSMKWRIQSECLFHLADALTAGAI